MYKSQTLQISFLRRKSIEITPPFNGLNIVGRLPQKYLPKLKYHVINYCSYKIQNEYLKLINQIRRIAN